MKRLEFHYNMTIRFDTPVKDHHFTLKCLPHDEVTQRIEHLEQFVYPNYFISHSVDSFFNNCIYGFCRAEHDHFSVDVRGIAVTGIGRRGVYNAPGPEQILKYQTDHTAPGEMLTSCHRELSRLYESEAPELTVSGRTMFYVKWLYEHFPYESGATMITTTAEEAFQTGRGVCQDYAHILISLLRMDRIPCRYVTGMMIGEGFSHAWVEVLTENGLLAVDPTHGRQVDEDYISIAKGRDYRDCLLNQGVFTGCGRKALQTQTIRAEVREIGW